jgi:hypothetical protein
VKDFFTFYDELQLKPQTILLDVLEPELSFPNTTSFISKKDVDKSTFLQFISNAGSLVLPTNNLKILDVEKRYDGILLKPTDEIKKLIDSEFIARMRKSILLNNRKSLT